MAYDKKAEKSRSTSFSRAKDIRNDISKPDKAGFKWPKPINGTSVASSSPALVIGAHAVTKRAASSTVAQLRGLDTQQQQQMFMNMIVQRHDS